jgi:hypothetical protein
MSNRSNHHTVSTATPQNASGLDNSIPWQRSSRLQVHLSLTGSVRAYVRYRTVCLFRTLVESGRD